jgi:probable rRNA maturation factor
MISYHTETDFELPKAIKTTNWLNSVVEQEGKTLGEITIIFCSDAYLYDLNIKYLNHDTLTDIITFDYVVGKELHGDVYISVDRVKENAEIYKCSYQQELHRVMVHGVLHLCGYKDKSSVDSVIMRAKEDYYLNQFDALFA